MSNIMSFTLKIKNFNTNFQPLLGTRSSLALSPTFKLPTYEILTAHVK